MLIINSLPEKFRMNIQFKNASEIASLLDSSEFDGGLMPSLDLVNHSGLYISKKAGVALDGILSNSYFLLPEGNNKIEELFLRGDVSINEIILTKIIMAERFDISPNIILDTRGFEPDKKNYLVCGSTNFENDFFMNGISLADQTSELIDLPYVNFVFASKSSLFLEDLASSIADIESVIEKSAEEVIASQNYSETANAFIKENLNSVYFDLTENELTAVSELIKLPFYYGISDDIVEIKAI